MKVVEQLILNSNQAALWFLGQAGYLIRSGGITVAMDPYLTDSAGAISPDFARRIPPPIQPEDLRVDLYLVTHDHLDHLDPETIRRYPHRTQTQFVAPRLAARKLRELGVPPEQVKRLDAGESWTWRELTLTGVFALPTGADVLDTTGYALQFGNGRSLYHSADTGFTPLLLQAAPKEIEVLLVAINGKWGNLTVEQAVELTAVVKPRYVLPNHFDLMALNAENPETFRWFYQQRRLPGQCVVPAVFQPFIWDAHQ